MKVLTIPQGSTEWSLVRIGRPTCSNADKLLTPTKLEPSQSAGDYRNKLLAEWLIGAPMDSPRSPYMERGTEMEGEARAAYELEHGVEVRQVGFLLSDDERFGGSPDGMVADAGLTEIKCPSLPVHIGYFLEPASLVKKYWGQCQSLLYVSGREWIDLYSYNPIMPPVLHRITPDPEYQAAFGRALDVFLDDLDACREKLAPYRDEIARGELPPELASLVA